MRWLATSTTKCPASLGGDLDLAEQMFMRGLEQDPKFTGMRLELTPRVGDPSLPDEGLTEAHAVLEEKAPTNPADWALKDAQEAGALLASIRSKSS